MGTIMAGNTTPARPTLVSSLALCDATERAARDRLVTPQRTTTRVETLHVTREGRDVPRGAWIWHLGVCAAHDGHASGAITLEPSVPRIAAPTGWHMM